MRNPPVTRRWPRSRCGLAGPIHVGTRAGRHQLADRPGTGSAHPARPAGCWPWPTGRGSLPVLTNAVRMADRRLAPTVDVLDASRRLVALDRRHVDQSNAEAYLKSGKEMQLLADEVAQRSGRGERGGRRLLAATRAVGAQLRAGSGRGSRPGHAPSAGTGGRRRQGRCGVSQDRAPGGAGGAPRCCEQRCDAGTGAPYAAPLPTGAQRPPRRRAGRGRPAGVRLVLPDRGRRRRADRRARHPLRRPRLRGRQLDQLRARDLRRRAVGARSADGAVPVGPPADACPTSTWTWSPSAGPRSTR